MSKIGKLLDRIPAGPGGPAVAWVNVVACAAIGIGALIFAALNLGSFDTIIIPSAVVIICVIIEVVFVRTAIRKSALRKNRQ